MITFLILPVALNSDISNQHIMDKELKFFIGFSDDAKEEAKYIYELEKYFQKTLRRFISFKSSKYHSLRMYLWPYDAELGIGGQKMAIEPFLINSDLAIFVFKERVGAVTWEELCLCRKQEIPVVAVFPTNFHDPSQLNDLNKVTSWQELLSKKMSLTEDWNSEVSQSITPVSTYDNTEHLVEIIKERIPDLMPKILHSATMSSELKDQINRIATEDKSIKLEASSSISIYDPVLIQNYKAMLRKEKLDQMPKDIGEQELLVREGLMKKDGTLTYAGLLLFGVNHTTIIPSAIIRLAKYEGKDRTAPRKRHNVELTLINQILEARKFIEKNIESRDLVSEGSSTTKLISEYPMKCIREVIANAICHRDYSDFNRITYVRIFDDRIEITNPGTWGNDDIPNDQTFKLSKFIGQPVERNILLAKAISSVNIMEMEGSGIETSVKDCEESMSPEPTVVQSNGYITVTVFPRASWNWKGMIKNPFVIPGLKKIEIDSQLNPNYTFESYIEGDCNRLARSAAVAVSKTPGVTAFNPLLIYGGVGLGKTHLAQAIGNYVKANNSNKVVLYVSSDMFTNQFIEALKNNSVNDFIHFYQIMDVLIIDDIQFFSNSAKTQDIFFHIINHLNQNSKQLVLTSDRPLKDLNGFEERLFSRLRSGLSTDLQRPEFDTRIAILEHKMSADGIEIAKEVVEFVAINIKTNVRELEGVLISLLAQSSLTKQDITIDLANKIVAHFVKGFPIEISIKQIQKIVCRHLGVDSVELKSKSRNRKVVQARQLCMFFSKELTNNSLNSIGLYYGGRDHSYVIHSCQAVANLIDTDEDFRNIVDELRELIEISD